MKLQYDYDSNTDCAYIRINNLPYAYSKELDETRFIDYAEDGTVIGVELPYVNGGASIVGSGKAGRLVRWSESVWLNHDCQISNPLASQPREAKGEK